MKEFVEFIGVRISAEEKKRLEELAKAEDRTISNFCRRILQEYLRQLEEHEKAGTSRHADPPKPR